MMTPIRLMLFISIYSCRWSKCYTLQKYPHLLPNYGTSKDIDPPGCEKICRVGEKLIIFLLQIPDLFFCKIPFSNHFTINVAKLDLITDSADESVFLNIHNLSCFTAADCFSFFYVFSDCDILLLGNYYDEIRQDS